jgi:hypothetical protein
MDEYLLKYSEYLFHVFDTLLKVSKSASGSEEIMSPASTSPRYSKGSSRDGESGGGRWVSSCIDFTFILWADFED